MTETNHPHVKFGPHKGSSYENSQITLATHDPKSHVNIYFQQNAKSESLGQCICASPADAMKLRDELLKLFPLAQASTYDPKNPKAGDVVLLNSLDSVGYFKLHYRNFEAPYTITARGSYYKWEDTYLVDFTDRNGKSGVCFANRFKAYGSPVVEKPITKADLLAAEERGRATSFAAGKRAGREEAEAERKAKQPKWEVVTDGLDRCKVEGGYIYQTINESITFVPDTNPSARPGVTGVCTYNAPCSARRSL